MEVRIHDFDPCSPRALTVTSVTGLPCIGGLGSPIIIIFISLSSLSLFKVQYYHYYYHYYHISSHCTLSVTVEVLSIAAAMIPLYWMIIETLPAQISPILNPASTCNPFQSCSKWRTKQSMGLKLKTPSKSERCQETLMIWLNVKLWIKYSDSMMFTKNDPGFLTMPVCR